MYKILTGKYDIDVTPKVLECTVRQPEAMCLNQKKVEQSILRKFYFTNRVVNAWNSLPDHLVLSEIINTFRSRLDKFWLHQDMFYDFQAELHGTGSCSLHSNQKLEYIV